MARGSLGEDRDAGAQVGAGLEVRELLPVLAAALVARAHADDAAALHEQVRRGRLRHDRDAELLGAFGQPAADLVDRRDPVAVVPHGRRRRDADRALAAQVVDALALDRRDERHVLGEHAGEELAERPRVHDRAGEQVRAGRLALLHHRDRHVAEPLGQLRALLEELRRANRRGEARRAAADDQDPDVDALVRRVRGLGDELVDVVRRREVSGAHARDYPRRARTSSVSLGTIACRSPTTDRSAYSKIGAFGSLLIATTVPELCIPTLCWIAPEIPAAM